MEHWKENVNYRKQKLPDGTVRYLVHIDGQDVDVSKSLYEEYTRIERRERYLVERDIGVCLSLERFSEDELCGEHLADSGQRSLEDTVLDGLDAQQQAQQLAILRITLPQLTKKEQSLIRALYFDGIAQREYARQQGVSLRAVQKQHERILRQLQRKLHDFENNG